MTCTCGTATTHEIARRTTLDGATIRFWSDGTLTGQWHDLPGIGRKRLPGPALWALASEVCITTAEELPARFRAYREATGATPADCRVAAAPPIPRPGAFRSSLADHVRDCRKPRCRTCL